MNKRLVGRSFIVPRSAFIVYDAGHMLSNLLGRVWQASPRRMRRWGVWLWEPRFMVTAGAVVLDEAGRVLLLKHIFRSGSGWGIPGGFIEAGEQPEEALRRELREEVGIEIERVELAFVRTLRRPQQVEVMFRCRARSDATNAAHPRSMEIESLAWFALVALPPALPAGQQRLIERTLGLDVAAAK